MSIIGGWIERILYRLHSAGRGHSDSAAPDITRDFSVT